TARPLSHIPLFHLSFHKHVLLIDLPSLCADVIGLRNLARDISRSYAARSHEGSFSDEPLQYIVVAEWLNELLASGEAELGRRYWRKQTSPDLLTVGLAAENQFSEVLGFAPQYLSLTVGLEVQSKIDNL